MIAHTISFKLALVWRLFQDELKLVDLEDGAEASSAIISSLGKRVSLFKGRLRLPRAIFKIVDLIEAKEYENFN